MIAIEDFAAEALAFLSAHLDRREDEHDFRWGQGSDEVSILGDRSEADEQTELERAQRWQAAKFEAGYGWLTGPAEYGGRELPLEYSSLFGELESGFRAPDRLFFGVGQGMVGPTILAYGSAELREKYLRGLYRGDVVGCQLFSEPDAGSDLAATRTTAVRSGDGWLVNGQKVWTSGAQYSHIGLLLARTNPSVAKHRGLTVFLLDMSLPGVTVRPLRQLTGGAHFNEVFFDDVLIPDGYRLGEVDDGWRTATSVLLKERASLGPGGANASLGQLPFAQLTGLLREFDGARDVRLRRELARVYSLQRIAELTSRRLLQARPPGQPPGPELSICKLQNTDRLAATASLVTDVLGSRLAADTGRWGTYAWNRYVLAVPGMRLGGGTDEIQKNIISERVLGLPREAAQ